MKLARSKEAKKLFDKDPCKIFTDRYILVRNHNNRAKIYLYFIYSYCGARVKFEFYFKG